MKRSISLAIFIFMMALPVLFTSCGGDDDLLPNTPEVQKPTITEWVEPFHVQGATTDDVKSYMASSMKNYSLTGEYNSSPAYQLAYTSDYKNVGVLYSFSKLDNGLYSVVATELCANKEVVLKKLFENYESVAGTVSDAQNIQYMFCSKDKSIVVSTIMISEECFNVNYTFVSR